MIRDNAPGHTYFISKEIKTKTWPKADGLTLVTTLAQTRKIHNKTKVHETDKEVKDHGSCSKRLDFF